MGTMKLALLAAAVFTSSCALAQGYPAKPIRLVTPYSPGGAGDWVARATTDRMALALGQQFVLEPRPGAGGNIAAESVVRSPADGYTLLFATPLLAINASLYKKLTFDASKDLVPIAVIATGPYVLYATGALPVKSGGDLVAMAKQKPGSINYASLGIGTGPHLGAVLLGLAGGVEFTHVPYKGFGQALPDLASGQVHFTLNGIGVADAFLKDGRIRMLGFTGSTRMKEYPDVPTVAESVPGFEVYGWYGLAAPAGTPTAIVERLNAEVAKAMAPEFVSQVEKRGLIPQSFTPAQTREFVARDSERWARAVKASGAKIDE
jgi:tripartite-type tricarboxylate transporter receptor subunit TctC